MLKNILVTGVPKSGKSTLLRKLIADIPNKIGFVTNEILGENGRVGFEMETNTGRKATLAHVDSITDYRVSKYFVDPENLESLIPEVSNFEDNNFLYLDEIGQMQLFSNKFKDLVLHYLNSQNTCLVAISYVFDDEFTRSIRERDDVILVEISVEDREEKERFLSQLLRKIEKAKRYVREPGRFQVEDSNVELKSEHSIRKLILTEGKWNCNCEFFKQYGVCSHSIATKEIVKL